MEETLVDLVSFIKKGLLAPLIIQLFVSDQISGRRRRPARRTRQGYLTR